MTHNDANDLNLSVKSTDLKPLFKTDAFRHASAIALDWVLIAATIIATSYFFTWYTYLLATLIIGARMHALAILMHDASHYRFLKNRKWNDRLTNLLIMYPLFSSIEVYRRNHMRHHRHLNTEDDPDWVSKLGKKSFTFPKTKQAFLLTILSYFTLVQGIKDAIWFLKRFSVSTEAKQQKAKGQKNRASLIFMLSLFALLTIFNGWAYYALFWVVPYLSTFFMFQYIRSVAEHFGELSYDHLLTSTRTVKTNLLEQFLLAPHNVGYHLEHHLYPAVPFYNLPKLHDLLMEGEDYKNKAHVTQGYFIGLVNELGKVGELIPQKA